jgi:hypothetical protein
MVSLLGSGTMLLSEFGADFSGGAPGGSVARAVKIGGSVLGRSLED